MRIAHDHSYPVIGGVLLASVLSTFGGSMCINYAEVLVENLQPGTTCSMERVANLPFAVVNKREVPVTLSLEVSSPAPAQAKKGFAPVPISWVSLATNQLDVAPGATGRTDVVIVVPDDDRFLGGRYQAGLVAMESANGGIAPLSMSLEGRLLFTVAPERREPTASDSADVNRAFSLAPERVVVERVPLGVTIPVRLPGDRPVEIENPSDQEMEFRLHVVEPSASVLSAEEGFPYAPHIEWVHVEEQSFRVPPHSRRPLDISLNLPMRPDLAGQGLFFVVAVSTTGGGTAEVRRYLKILASAAPYGPFPPLVVAGSAAVAAAETKL